MGSFLQVLELGTELISQLEKNGAGWMHAHGVTEACSMVQRFAYRLPGR